MNENTMKINGHTIEGKETGMVFLDGKRAKSIDDLEKVISLLIKSAIALAQK